MKKIAALALLSSLIACASPDSPARLAAPGLANTPTREGTMPTTATQTKLPNGTSAWSVNCQTGRNYLPCESRVRSLCPNGYTEISRNAAEAKNTSGVIVQTVTTPQGSYVTGINSTVGPPSRTIIVTCK